MMRGVQVGSTCLLMTGKACRISCIILSQNRMDARIGRRALIFTCLFPDPPAALREFVPYRLSLIEFAGRGIDRHQFFPGPVPYLVLLQVREGGLQILASIALRTDSSFTH